MQQIVLSGTNVSVSRFILGTAGLFNIGAADKRIALLDAAVDHGFTHFDTAPLYGFGSAERALASVLARNPNTTVTTKVGIYSPGGEGQPDWAVFLRKAGGRVFSSISRPIIDWSVARARIALEASLRRLGRSHVDLYMLHEPDFRLCQSDEWLRWLEGEVAAGRVRQFGIAAEAGRLPPFLADASPLAAVIQTTDSLEGREADVVAAHGRPIQITYGYVSEAIRRHGRADVSAVLAQALARNRDGAIIVSTSKVARLPQYAALASATQ